MATLTDTDAFTLYNSHGNPFDHAYPVAVTDAHYDARRCYHSA